MEYRKRYVSTNLNPRPTALFPQLDDYDVMIHNNYPPDTDEIQLVFNVRFFNPEELSLLVSPDNIVEIHAKHQTRKANGIYFTRGCHYTYKLPEYFSKKELRAEWTRDQFLIIKGKDSSDDDKEARKEQEKRSLVPEMTETVLKPTIDASQLKEKLKFVEGKLKEALNYVQYHAFVQSDVEPIARDDVAKMTIEQIMLQQLRNSIHEFKELVKRARKETPVKK